MAELKPCPFCGGDVEETGGSCNFGKKIMTLNVKCRKCGTSVALKTAWNTNAYIEAVEAWNRRVMMAKFISKSQMEELEDACTFGIEGANKLLKKYAGIQARAYTAYNYYDENDNFLANSDEADIYGLLEMAGVEVRHGG